jgi:spore maturation protein CgeB
MPYSYNDYYTSDRVFIAVASGVPFVDHWVPGVDRILEPGRDWWLAHDQREMFSLCDKVLEMTDGERSQSGQQAREGVLAHHTQYHRCAEMVEIVRSLRDAHQAGRRAAVPQLRFLAKAFPGATSPESIVGWEG